MHGDDCDHIYIYIYIDILLKCLTNTYLSDSKEIREVSCE